MLKREWGGESNEKLPHVFIPSETATLVPQYVVEDLPLLRSSLGVEICSEKPAFGQNTLMMILYGSS